MINCFLAAAAEGVESNSQNTLSTEEKPHVTEVKGEKNVFVLGEDDNIQSSTMDDILSRHVSKTDTVPAPFPSPDILSLNT